MFRHTLDTVMRQESATPTIELVSALCPHLSDAGVRDLLLRADQSNDLIEFAVPSVLISDSYHVFGIAPPRKCSSFLTYVRHKRTANSFADGVLRFDYPEARPVLFAEEALAFSLAQWPKTLVKDNWLAVHRFYLYNPLPLPAEASVRCPLRPRLMREVSVALTRTAEDVAKDQSAPLMDVLDQATAHVTTWHCEARELAGGRLIRHQNNCSCCGDSLDLMTCKKCGLDLQHPQEIALPLPPKVMRHLRQLGHHFQVPVE